MDRTFVAQVLGMIKDTPAICADRTAIEKSLVDMANRNRHKGSNYISREGIFFYQTPTRNCFGWMGKPEDNQIQFWIITTFPPDNDKAQLLEKVVNARGWDKFDGIPKFILDLQPASTP
jgi:hypothetical protein